MFTLPNHSPMLRAFAVALAFLHAANLSCAQSSVREETRAKRASGHLYQSFTPERWDQSSFAPPGALDWWREARFGIFLHLGVSSLRGVELGWGRHTRIAPDGGVGPVPDQEYDNLYKEFKLESFDAKEWVRIAKDAGAGYIVVITKHHDGFHMWDTQLSEYKITNAPFGRDYVKEVIDACHEAKMPIGLYFAQREWYHPQYDPRGKDPKRDHKKYIDYQFKAVRELLTKYGKIDILWFDAAWWGGMFKEDDWDSERLYRMARELQPHILINNRASIPGDFDTPEQHVGAFQNNRPWESCVTMLSSNSWAYDAKSGVKPLKQLIGFMVSAATGDGNILLNVGPRTDGTIQPKEVERLHEVGDWFRKYGRTIYGTRGGPYMNGAWGGTTHKGNKIWVHILNGQETTRLSTLPCKLLSSEVLTGGSAEVASTKDGLVLTIARKDHDPIDTIVELTVERVIGPTEVFGQSQAADSVEAKHGRILNAGVALKHGPATEANPWVEADLGKSHQVNAVAIMARKGAEASLKGTVLLLSEDGKNWTKAWTAPDANGKWLAELSHFQAGVNVPGASARYVRLQLPANSGEKPVIEKVEVHGE